MNNRISDPRLLEALQTGACPLLPNPVHRPAFRIASRLLAAASWADVYYPVAPLPAGRFAVHVFGRWVISFAWSSTALAHALALERIKE